ncbi:MAG: glycosyltransferase family 2 protein [Sulfuricellaceae bacterium]|nr:glycosyltransferase family 2 protein [Sulfuricellaceae bacterium]
MQRSEAMVGTCGAARVSIVVPMFNAEQFLELSIGSVFQQTIPDWELILVDDGSSDGSGKICAQHAQDDPRIRVVSQANRGPSAARNAGVSVASGEFIFFLDADDYLFPDALENLLSAIDESGADMALGNFCKQEDGASPIPQPVIFGAETPPFLADRRMLKEMDLLDYVRHFFMFPSNHLVSYCWARLYRRSIILRQGLKAEEDMQLFEDFAFNLDYLGETRNLVFVNKPVYVYVLRGTHVSASMTIMKSQRLVSDMQAFRDKVDRFLGAIGVDGARVEKVRREVGHALVHYAIIFLVRTCRQMNAENQQAIFNEIRVLVGSSVMQDCLPCYQPRPGSSRIVPLLMRLRLVWMLAMVCKQKGLRRYGKMRGAS